MSDEATPPLPLDYHGPRPKRAKYVPTVEDRRWRNRRILLRLGIFVALFPPIALYFVPNLIMFGTLRRMTPEDFAPLVQPQSIAIVRAMKEYQRDTGQLPFENTDLVPKYLPPVPTSERYIIHGYFVNGTISTNTGRISLTISHRGSRAGWWTDLPPRTDSSSAGHHQSCHIVSAA